MCVCVWMCVFLLCAMFPQYMDDHASPLLPVHCSFMQHLSPYHLCSAIHLNKLIKFSKFMKLYLSGYIPGQR